MTSKPFSLRTRLNEFARVELAHLPTRLEAMPRLQAEIGGPALWIKRDDATGLSTGGNKARKLEFLLAEALGQGADCLVTVGATQSNHVRQTAAAAARAGLDCFAVLEDRGVSESTAYKSNGNYLLDQLHGAEITRLKPGQDGKVAMAELVERLRGEGRKPYAVPGGGSNPVGSLGYVDCARELVQQCRDIGIAPREIVVASGSAGTQAGLLTGLRALGDRTPVLGIGVRAPRAAQEARVFDLAVATADLLGCPGCVARDDVVVDDTHIGAGYGLATETGLEAISLFARREAQLLDPVYSGKAAAGLIHHCRVGRYASTDHVIFLHSGGTAGLFGYCDLFGGGMGLS
ncbi:D-cysteine desulfhydrase [Celeribacter sp. SCSIO 80788]|uniref:D-cysteine desulfhydrase n=1 Tax=Celeribacter sp. SCSIO 80788 TaxID=3117013 RepID=UPI003DA491E8